MAIIGESLEGYVDNQIKVRQELQGKKKRSELIFLYYLILMLG